MTVFSHSRLESFETCQLKYKFRYIDRLEKPGIQSVEAFVGNRVHEVLKKLYEDLLGAKRNTLEELLRFYRKQWKKEWGPGITIVAAHRTQKDYLEYGAACIRNYFEKQKPFDRCKTVATEQKVDFSLDAGGAYPMTGYVDRIDRRDDGTYEIHDYKTSKSLPPQSDADASRQLGLYQLGVQKHWQDAAKVELNWHYLRHGVTLRSTRTPQQLSQLCETTAALIDRIEAQREFTPSKGRLCDWCEYKPDCPEWKPSLFSRLFGRS